MGDENKVPAVRTVRKLRIVAREGAKKPARLAGHDNVEALLAREALFQARAMT